MILIIFQWLLTIIIAFLVGKLLSRLKLPAILGWLITGMLLGPHALSLLGNELLSALWYQDTVHVLECAVGLMIGTELVIKKIKKTGSAIIITTLTQSLGTFLFVSLVFSVIFFSLGYRFTLLLFLEALPSLQRPPRLFLLYVNLTRTVLSPER